MTKGILRISISTLIFSVGVIFIVYSISDNRKSIETILPIVYQNNYLDNHKSIAEVACEYEGKIYSTKIFRNDLNLNYSKAVFKIYKDSKNNINNITFLRYAQ